MNALTQLRRVDSNIEAGDALANRRRISVTRPSSRKERKESTSLDARVRSLKILALTLSREIEALEAQNAPGIRGALDLQTEVRRFEAEIIRSALIQTRGRQRPAARLLGMKPTTLNSKVKRYRIDVKEEADESKEQRHGR